jgi:nickel/cobalt transporter (NicO) family protein
VFGTFFSKLSSRASWIFLAVWFGVYLSLGPIGARAHPLDEFYEVTFITVAPAQINLKVELYTGVLIAPQILALIDGDQDEQISEVEAQAYVERFLKDVTFEIDQTPTPLSLTHLDFPSAVDLRAGVGIIRFNLTAALPAGAQGQHQLYYRNNHLPDIANYVVNVLSETPAQVELGRQERDVFQASLRLDYTLNLQAPAITGTIAAPVTGSAPAAAATSEVSPAPETGARLERLSRYLYNPDLSPLFMAAGMGLSILLGGLHALTPGHGKTLVAAYLIGSRGTVRHAVMLGGVVTFTHTASVIAIGLLALLASRFLVPQVMVPLLETLSGLLVVYIGCQLSWSRWRGYQTGESSQPQPYHDQLHPHDHPHDHHDHHHHLPDQIRPRDLLALGISGGIIPCPEALGIMLVAVGLNRILLGLGLVVAFSFGLALVLIIIGILLVRARFLLDRFGAGEGRWQSLLPLASAMMVTLLGLGIMLKGLMAYLGG